MGNGKWRESTRYVAIIGDNVERNSAKMAGRGMRRKECGEW
jgi:hypothetical protein